MSQFLAAYERYAASATDAPIDFLHAGGLAVLSTISLGRRWIDRGSSGVHPNIYFMLLAGSTRDRKSTAVNMGIEVLQKIERGRVGPEDFSGEGLVWAMTGNAGGPQKSKIIIPAPEFGNYLATAGKNYGANMSPTLCRLYDGDTFTRARSGKAPVKIKKPRVSLLGGVAFGMLERYADPTDWVTGFFARVLWISPLQRRQKFDLMPSPDKLAHREMLRLAGDLRLMLKAAPQPMELTAGAQELFSAYSAEMPDVIPDPAVGAQRERLMTSVLKLSILYQVDLDHQAPISARAMDSAVQFGRRAWSSFEIAYADSSGSPLGRLAKKIWRELTDKGPLPKRELYRVTHAKIEDFMPAVELLLKMGVVGNTQVNRLPHYRAVDPYTVY